jgi:hypothetical protein
MEKVQAMAWLRQIGGRLESRYRYSIGIVYNPWPEATDQQRVKVRSLAQAVLDARAQFPSSTLAGLYEKLVAPLVAATFQPPRRPRRRT